MSTTKEAQKNSFKVTLNALRAHAKYNLDRIFVEGGTYAPTTYALSPGTIDRTAAGKIPEAAKTATRDFNDKTNEFSDGEKNELEKDAQDLANKKMTPEEYKAKSRARREAAKNKASAQIDEYYDRIDEIAEENDYDPAVCDPMLDMADKVLQVFMGVVNAIANFILDLINKFVEWLKELGTKILNKFGEVAETIARGFSSVYALFGF